MSDDQSFLWSPRLLQAAAASQTQFAIALGELQYDDPFTALILYNGIFSQPWERIDVQREINAVLPVRLGQDGREFDFAALSNEGDFYYLGDEITREKIPGAGVLSEDATGAGALYDLAHDGDAFIAVGDGAQIYRRVGENDWRLDLPQLIQEPGFEAVGFGSVAPLSPSSAYAVGAAYPTSTEYNVTEDPEFSPDLNADQLIELFRRGWERSAQQGPHGPESRVYHFNGTDWRRLEVPTSNLINDVFIESETRIWMVGQGGVILLGNAEHGFRDVSFHGDTETLVSVTKFQDRIIVASDHGLHSFDGHVLSRIRPRIDPAVNNAVPNPIRVQAVDDMLFYFDSGNGIHCWDGVTWTAIPIPPALLVRDFQGLPPRD